MVRQLRNLQQTKSDEPQPDVVFELNSLHSVDEVDQCEVRKQPEQKIIQCNGSHGPAAFVYEYVPCYLSVRWYAE